MQKSNKILIGGTFLLFVFYVATFLHHGLTTTSDSQGYLLAVLGLTAKKQIMLSPVWPFGYPFLIYLVSTFGFFPAQAAGVVNAFALFGIFLCVALIAKKQSRNIYLSAILVIFCFTWHELFYISRVIWSETLYTSLTCIHFYFLLRHLQSGKREDFIYAAMTASLPLLTRYIGYSMIGCFILYTLLWSFYKEKKVNIKEMVEYLGIIAISNILHVLWLYRNYDFQKTLHGKRRPSKISFGENLSDLTTTLSEQLTHTPFLWLVLLAALGSFFHEIWKKKAWNTSALFVVYLYTYVALYVGLLLYSASTANLDRISPRFTTPILLPLLLTIPHLWHVISLQQFFHFSKKIKGTHLLFGALVFSLLGGIYNSQEVIDSHFLHVKSSKHPITYGFEKTDTAKEIHDILGDYIQSDENEKVVMTSIIKTKQSGQGFAFMTREAIWDGESFSFEGYIDLSPESIVVEVANDDKKIELIHWLYEPLMSPVDFERMLSKIQSKTKSNSVLIFAEPKYLSKIGIPKGKLGKIKMDFYSCDINDKLAKPFLVYVCKNSVNETQYETVDTLSRHELIISEIMVRPLIANHRGQWFELYNNSNKEINLKGLIVSNGKQEMTVDMPVIVAPNAYTVFALRGNPKMNGGIEKVGFEYTLDRLKFRNGGKLEIRNVKGMIDTVLYRLGQDGINGKGVSIHRTIEDALQSKRSDWCESTIEYGPGGKGSPGEENEKCDITVE